MIDGSVYSLGEKDEGRGGRMEEKGKERKPDRDNETEGARRGKETDAKSKKKEKWMEDSEGQKCE